MGNYFSGSVVSNGSKEHPKSEKVKKSSPSEIPETWFSTFHMISSPSRLEQLPTEILFEIFSFLGPKSVGRMTQVNCLFRNLCSHEPLWKYFTQQMHSNPKLILPPKTTWKDFYVVSRSEIQFQKCFC